MHTLLDNLKHACVMFRGESEQTELMEGATKVVLHFIRIIDVFPAEVAILRQEGQALPNRSRACSKRHSTKTYLCDHVVSIVRLSLHRATYGGDG